jgi:hypothetical protein
MRLGVGVLVGLCLFVLFPAGAHAAPIYLDAKFSDWNGKACLTDGLNDTIADTNDISYWYFTTNDGESRLYVMVQRFMDNTASKSVAVVLHHLHRHQRQRRVGRAGRRRGLR